MGSHFRYHFGSQICKVMTNAFYIHIPQVLPFLLQNELISFILVSQRKLCDSIIILNYMFDCIIKIVNTFGRIFLTKGHHKGLIFEFNQTSRRIFHFGLFVLWNNTAQSGPALDAFGQNTEGHIGTWP